MQMIVFDGWNAAQVQQVAPMMLLKDLYHIPSAAHYSKLQPSSVDVDSRFVVH